MNRTWLLPLGITLLTAGISSAQYGSYPVPNYGPGYRTNISPYLNIFRGFNTGIDYYLGTRSEYQRRQNAQEFRSEISNLERFQEFGPYGDGSSEGDRPISSGSAAMINDTGGYFNNTGGYFSSYSNPMGPVRPGSYVAPPRRGGQQRPGPSQPYSPRSTLPGTSGRGRGSP